MATDAKLRITLVGGGLGGALLATYLGRAGHEIDLYERRPDPGAGNFVGGRSINLARSGGNEELMYALILATGVLGLLLNAIFQRVERRVLHWHPSQRGAV